MTDKEQIMIDGVDVSGCPACNLNCGIPQCSEFFKHFSSSIYCRDNANCLFKQLARKTQECERLKEDYKELEQRHNGAFQDFERLKQECEELKRQLSKKRTEFDKLNYDFGSLWLVKNCYRRALEEIGELCEEILGDLLHYSQGSINTAEKILNIINKAKGENNGINDNSK